MATLEEFGPYLLLKKLGEDSLGETFRAGRIGAEGVEQVVLLRVFNGRNVNGARLWERIAGRRAVQEALKNPNLGDGVGLGEVRGIPYVAYDYLSGKSLTQLLVQASTENQPIPLDHALLIVERVSLGLATAYETKVDGQRLVHGFVVPHLVMISNEGEARLLGFEASPGLVDLARGGAFGSEVTRYLAPEARTSGVAEKADDVYSLGVLLYELATCRPLPEPGEQGFGPILESAHIPGEGGPLPAEVARLIGRSLSPRGDRIGDAVSWHKAASKLMAESGHNATAFNLAFFMHNLFRTDIERESREIEAEKTLEIPASALAGATARPAAARPAGRPGSAALPAEMHETAEPVTMPHPVAGYGALSQPAGEAAATSSGSGKGLWIGLAAALLLLIGGGAAWWFLMGPGAGPTEQELAARAPAPVVPEPVVEEPPPEPAGPTPEEMQAQLAEMIDSRSEEMESKFRQQYDERIQQLQKELESAEKEAAERERLERERLEREAAEAAERERLAAEAAEQERLAAEKAEQERLAAEKAAADGTQPAADGGAQGGARAAGQRPPESEPKVQLGDLVSFGPGVNPPGLISIPEVRYPPMARKLGREATIEVRLLIDETGKVARTETVGKALGYGFEEAAIEAAGRAKYRPATKAGVRVKMWTSVKLRFENP
jgi:TonB family protein